MLDINNTVDFNNFILKHEREFEGKKYLYFPYREKNKVPTLLVAMSTHNFGERYYFLKGLLANQKCSLLFIKDPGNSYYFENDHGLSYSNLISKFVDIYGKNNVTLFGSSMSGYAALYHGLQLGTNVISSNPQINYDLSYREAWSDLKKTLERVKPYWINLNEYLSDLKFDSVLYVCYGDHLLDQVNFECLKSSNIKEGRLYLHKMCDNEHGFYLRDPKNVYKVHTLVNFSRNTVHLSK